MTAPLDRLLARTRPENDDAGTYRSMVTNTRPQMGFAINRANGDADGVFFHNIDNLNYQIRGGVEYLSFTHRAKAVTVSGVGLKVVFTSIMRHVLAELNEADGRPAKEGLPTIQRIEVTMAGQRENLMKLAK